MCRWNVTICACGFAWAANPPAQQCPSYRDNGTCDRARAYAGHLLQGNVGLGQYEIPPGGQCPHVKGTQIHLKVAGYRLAVITMSKQVKFYRSKRSELLKRYETRVAQIGFDSENSHHSYAASVVNPKGAASQHLSELLEDHAQAVQALAQYSNDVWTRNRLWAKDNPLKEINKLNFNQRHHMRHTIRRRFIDAVAVMEPIEAGLNALEASIDQMTIVPSIAASIHSGSSNSPPHREVEGNAVSRLNANAQAFAHQLVPYLLPAPTTYAEGAVDPSPAPEPTTHTEVAVYRHPQPLFVPYYPPPSTVPGPRTWGRTGNDFLATDFEDLEDELAEMHGEAGTSRGFLGPENVNDGFSQIPTSEDELPEIPPYEEFDL